MTDANDIVPLADSPSLVAISQAQAALEQVRDLSDIKGLSDWAERARQMQKASGESLWVQNRAAELRLRAERKLGEFLADMPDIKPGRPKSSHDGRINLEDLGINHNRSARSQRLASLPDDVFEDYIGPSLDRDYGDELTLAGALKKAKHKERVEAKRAADAEAQAVSPLVATIAQADQAVWLPEQPICDLLLTDPPYATDVDDIGVFAEWLPSALAKVKPSGRAYVCIGAYPEELAAYLSQPTAGMVLADVLVWTYRNTLGPSSPIRYTRNWQAILHFHGPEAPPLNTKELNEKFAVIDMNAPDGRLGERWHTWQKPDPLAERLVRHATEPGATVLDPFAGTGTFLLAAARLGRLGFGCDPDPDMVDIAVERGCRRV